jgi:neutral amino acid transport system ATP-binding protein
VQEPVRKLCGRTRGEGLGDEAPTDAAASVVTVASDVAPDPGVAKPEPTLVVNGLHRNFGGLVAVDVEHLEVRHNSITALIGPNGAGKTTMFNLLTGFDRPTRGEWSFEGEDLTGMPSYRIARKGLVRTFQLTKALARMSVLDNMMLAAPQQSGERLRESAFHFLWRSRERQVRARALALLERFDLVRMRDEYAGTLSGGQRKLLELARALMVEPRMVLLDEPTAGVNPVLLASILDHIRELRDQGMTVLFVEHDMDVVMGISDWVVCMDVGRVIAEGPPMTIGTNEAVIDAYLGARRDGVGS